MATAKQFGSVKRFGTRYGRTIRSRAANIEQQLRGKHKCPYCSAKAVKRITAGIWECRKCSAKFTGGAYTISKKIRIKEEKKAPVEEVQEAPAPEEELEEEVEEQDGQV